MLLRCSRCQRAPALRHVFQGHLPSNSPGKIQQNDFPEVAPQAKPGILESLGRRLTEAQITFDIRFPLTLKEQEVPTAISAYLPKSHQLRYPKNNPCEISKSRSRKNSRAESHRRSTSDCSSQAFRGANGEER